MTTNTPLLLARQTKLAEALKSAGLDALALNPGPSLAYLTGLHFHLMERPVIGIFRAEGEPLLVIPELESAKLGAAEYPLQAHTYGEDPTTWADAFYTAFSGKGLTKIGVENNQMRLLEFRILQAALPETVVEDAGQVVAGLRMFKDESEIANMQKAAKIAEAALRDTVAQIKIGMTEKQVTAVLLQQLLQHGSDGELPFQPIVSTGPNGANPHAVPSERKLASGDLLVIDFGASYDGYFSDITRTFAVGRPSPEQERVYNTVLTANQAGRETGKPGVTCSTVDEAAREVIEDVGYGEYFTHRTGHGLGMEAHEEPYIRGGNPMVLAPGMSFTIEPGIYIPDQFGVRIEDDVYITADGLTSLTTYPRELQIIGV